MNVSDEGRVLGWFEQALAQPPERRLAWVDEQGLPEWLRARVRRLVEAESRLDRNFLETPPPLPETTAFPHVGDRVGNYELVQEIDSGGMGVVFLARRADRAYEQQVAIKLIRPVHLGPTSQFRRHLIARFENERALLARLNHRNVARILDGGSTEAGFPFIVMEYVEGVSLLSYCHSHRLDVRARVRLFRKVCEGVQEAHRHLIVHRDLKPENILVGADGEPRLLDFGIARMLEEPAEDGVPTLFTAMTPAYASPEQVRREPLTTSSDVYSLGVVLFQLIAEVRPYDLRRLSPAEAERLVSEARPPPLRTALAGGHLDDRERQQRVSQVSADLDRIIGRAMHKEPARRYGSAQELADDLERFLDGRPVRAHPDSAFYRLGKFVSRHRAATVAGVVATVLVIGAAGVAFWQARQAGRAASDTALMNSFLLDVFEMSDPFDAGSEITLSQSLDEAAKQIDTRFAGRPDLSAQLRFGIGYSMLSRYRLPEAEVQLTRALAENTAQFGPNDIRTLRAVEGMAGLRQEQGRPAEAEALFKQGIERMEKNGLQSDPLYADLLGNLGNLYLVQERYADAQKYLEKAVAAQPPAPGGRPTLDSANQLSNLAHAAHGLEEYERADELYQRAQRAYETLFPNGNPDLAILLNNRALLAEDRGRKQDARALHERSLAVRQRVFGGEHPMIVVALSNVARMSVELGDPATALKRAREAVTMADRVYKEPIARHASVYATLAEANLVNDDSAAAVSALEHAQALLAKTQDPPPSVERYLSRVRTAICTKGQFVICLNGGAASGISSAP